MAVDMISLEVRLAEESLGTSAPIWGEPELLDSEQVEAHGANLLTTPLKREARRFRASSLGDR